MQSRRQCVARSSLTACAHVVAPSQALMVFIFMVISGLGLFALYRSMKATRTAKEARRQEQLAVPQTVRGNEQAAIAEQSALVATAWLYLFHARQDESGDGFAQAAIRYIRPSRHAISGTDIV